MTDYYTPTTEEVRNGFANNQFLKSGQDVAYLMEFAGTHQKEFDRWLEKHDAEVAKAEREGIIALLIELLEGYFSPEEAKAIYPANYHQYLDIIALIKGENE